MKLRDCLHALGLDLKVNMDASWAYAAGRVVDGATVLHLSQTAVLRRARRRAMMQTWMQRRTSGSRSRVCQKRPAMSNGRETRTPEPRGLGIDVKDAQVISKQDHARAAAIAA